MSTVKKAAVKKVASKSAKPATKSATKSVALKLGNIHLSILKLVNSKPGKMTKSNLRATLKSDRKTIAVAVSQLWKADKITKKRVDGAYVGGYIPVTA